MSIGEICDRRVPALPSGTTGLAAAKAMHSFGDRLAVVTDERAGRSVAAGVVTEHELVGAMVHGKREFPGDQHAPVTSVRKWRVVAGLLFACALTWWVAST